MKAKENLLKENKKAFQFLHLATGMDFTKPYIIIEGNGNFTHKKILAALHIANVYEYNIVMLMNNTDGHASAFRDKFRYIKITPTEFISVDTAKHYSYNYHIDDYWSKGYFEEDRKKADNHYFVIAQRKNDLTAIPQVRPLDTSDRYTVKEIGHFVYTHGKESYIGKVEIHSKSFANDKVREYKPSYFRGKEYKTIEEVIDKSGYIRSEYISELNRRARVLEAERKAAAAKVYDSTAETEGIRNGIAWIKAELVKLMTKAETKSDYSEIGEITSKMRWLVSDFEDHNKKIAEKSYPSIDRIQKDIEEMDARIKVIISILKA